jgi:cytidyltransferase-like protein
MKYSLFIGKFQPFHKGHKWLIEERLKLGKNVLIGIRDTVHDRKQYLKSVRDVMLQVFQFFPNEVNVGTIDFIQLPDIESVNYGRDVGYDIIEHIPPEDIKEISGTKIREENGN